MTPFMVPGLPQIPYVAGEDLSAYQYKLVKAGSTELQVVHITSASDVPVAVSLDIPNAALKQGEWGTFGIYPVIAGGTVTHGTIACMDSSGRVVAAAPGLRPVGFFLTSGVLGDRVAVFLTLGAGMAIGEIQAVAGSVSIDPGSIASVSTGTGAGTITGLNAGDGLIMYRPAALNDDLIVSGYIPSTDTVTVYLYNPTVGAIDDTARTWSYVWFKLS